MIARRLLVVASLAILSTLSALATLGPLGCSRWEGVADEPWVAEAGRRHALADERLEVGDRPGAREALRGILEARPPADLPADDRRRVLQDTYFRLARIDLDARDPNAALADAEAGLALGRPSDLFVANLLIVRGATNEAMGNAPLAAVDYHQALLINDELLSKALNGRADGSPAPARTP